jgi:hypothetical protein
VRAAFRDGLPSDPRGEGFFAGRNRAKTAFDEI